MNSLDLSAVNWRELGEQAAVMAAAFVAAFAGARRVWKKGLGELLRPAIQKEVGAAVRSTLRSLRLEVVQSVTQQVRAAMHEELAPLQEAVDELSERMARAEGALDVLTNTGKPTAPDTK